MPYTRSSQASLSRPSAAWGMRIPVSGPDLFPLNRKNAIGRVLRRLPGDQGGNVKNVLYRLPVAGGGREGGLHDGKEGFPGVGVGGYHHGDRPREDAEEDLKAR
jgi:hypothetical protein